MNALFCGKAVYTINGVLFFISQGLCHRFHERARALIQSIKCSPSWCWNETVERITEIQSTSQDRAWTEVGVVCRLQSRITNLKGIAVRMKIIVHDFQLTCYFTRCQTCVRMNPTKRSSPWMVVVLLLCWYFYSCLVLSCFGCFTFTWSIKPAKYVGRPLQIESSTDLVPTLAPRGSTDFNQPPVERPEMCY